MGAQVDRKHAMLAYPSFTCPQAAANSSPDFHFLCLIRGPLRSRGHKADSKMKESVRILQILSLLKYLSLLFFSFFFKTSFCFHVKLVKTKYHFNQNSLLTIISQIKRLETLPCRKVGGGGLPNGKSTYILSNGKYDGRQRLSLHTNVLCETCSAFLLKLTDTLHL